MSALQMGVALHFGHAGPIAPTDHTGGLRCVASALVARTLGGVSGHSAGGCVGGATWNRRLSCGIFVVWSTIVTVHPRACHCRIVHATVDAIVLVMLFSGNKTTRSTDGCKLRIPVLSVLASPELCLARAGSVVVGGRGTIALLPFVRSGKSNLEAGRNKEKEAVAYIISGQSRMACNGRPGEGELTH